MAFKLAELFIEITTKGYDKVQAQMSVIKNQVGQLASTAASGLGVAVGASALVAFLKSSVLAFEESEQAARRLDATVRLAGVTIGRTSFEIQNLAGQLANLSSFQDDAIAGAAAMLAEFQNIRGDTFDQALRSVVDLASRTGDLSGSARSLGAALDDPINNLGLLRRQFRAFSADVEENAKTLAKSGDIIGAQNLILQELERTTGGMASQLKNPVTDLKNAWGETLESIGRNMRVQFGGMTSTLNDFSKALDSGAVSDFVNKLNPLTNLVMSFGGLGGFGGVERDRSERAKAAANAARGVAKFRDQGDLNAEAFERLRRESAEKREGLFSQLGAKGSAIGIAQDTAAFEVQLKQYQKQLEEVHATAEEITPLIENIRRQFEIQQSRKMMKLMASMDAEAAEVAAAEQIRFNQHIEDIKNELADAGRDADEIAQRIADIRTKFERDKEQKRREISLGIDANTLKGWAQDSARLNKELADTRKQMTDAGFSADEIQKKVQQIRDKFGRETGDKQTDLFKSLMGQAAPETIKRKLDIDFNANELKKKIEEAFPKGELADALVGDIEQLRSLQQKQEILNQQRAPEFASLTEMSRRIQSLAAGEGKQELEKRQTDILRDLQERATGSGLNVNLSRPSLDAIAAASALQ